MMHGTAPTTKNYPAWNVNNANMRTPTLTKYLVDGHLNHCNQCPQGKSFVYQPLSFVENFKTLYLHCFFWSKEDMKWTTRIHRRKKKPSGDLMTRMHFYYVTLYTYSGTWSYNWKIFWLTFLGNYILSCCLQCYVLNFFL